MLDFISITGCETVVAIIVVILCLYYYIRNRGLPPGPVSFPFFGYQLILKDETCHEELEKVQKKYGDVFCFTFAGNLFINIGSMKAMKEFHLTNADYFQRSSDYTLLSAFFTEGIFLVNGEPWKVLRKFILQQLREYGMTAMKENMSDPLYDSIQDTLGYLKAKEGEPVEIVEHLSDKCNVIIRQTMFGNDGISEKQVKEINDSFYHVTAFITSTNLLYAGFLARFMLPFKPGYWSAMKNLKIMFRVLDQIVEEHKVKFNKNQQPNNFIDAFLKERSDRAARGDHTAKYFTDKSLVASLGQFLGDGVLSVSLFISMFMTQIEEYQDKIYSEIVEVVGRDRSPTMEDKTKLPFTNAYIYEIMRTSKFFVLFPSQQCIRETVIRGYRIPKGAYTLMNMWTCHNDPEIYPEPEKFNPYRFMCEDKSKRPALPVTFGVGRRTCLGESFVMAQTFLFLTSILQKFRLSLGEDSKTESYEFIVTGKLNIRATPRE
ncbi:cytochrome P450 2J1 [Parasteatoda tepidariorum]|uniref:cytochrome P450 2J1 n=1 Tax=Parasteatoda tepidariorum TaxID=114398 RepID=UPI00077F9E3A|nr:cytochrome P450 2J1 [Parasteatoda tepidariorum]XP_042906019.1 cytochrome P450 2J1 [Parasteatoda tepidariorum]XP_042906020.1 cytochrome P450 2J1 [Parasteatoda tepidariorum]XP_042906021.1 cytochrome P450 2J1 [Parasteatoda tepidariorum]